MDIRIEALNTDNLFHLIDLYKQVFGKEVDLNYLIRKFDTSYLGKKYFGHLAFDNNKAVAFHGAIPFLMKYNDRFEIAAQYGDAMTLKQYTGNGFFTKLGQLTDDLLQSNDIKFVWGFPNQNSEYGYLNKLDWKFEERILAYKIRVNKFKVEKYIRKISPMNLLYKKYLSEVFENNISNEIIRGSVFEKDNVVSTSRDEQFYNYKNFTNNFTIKINNCLFWIKIDNGILVGDVEIGSIDQFIIALEKLKQLAAKCGIHEIIFQSSPKTIISDILSKKCKLNSFNTWIVGYKNFNSNFPLSRLKFTFGDLDTF